MLCSNLGTVHTVQLWKLSNDTSWYFQRMHHYMQWLFRSSSLLDLTVILSPSKAFVSAFKSIRNPKCKHQWGICQGKSSFSNSLTPRSPTGVTHLLVYDQGWFQTYWGVFKHTLIKEWWKRKREGAGKTSQVYFQSTFKNSHWPTCFTKTWRKIQGLKIETFE